MKKIIFGVFAHPDDESFGPAGTLLMEARSGTDVHLIALTAGEAGVNVDNHADLGRARLKEWNQAGKLIGARSMQFLGYKDGQLSNLDMIAICKQLTDLITAVVQHEPDDSVIEFMSLDLNGLTGHIDHIVAARSACYAFYRLKEKDPRFSRIRLLCIPEKQAPTHDTSWLFMEAGRTTTEIDEVIDATAHHDELCAIVKAHRTQRSDGDHYLQRVGDSLGMDYFIVRS